MENFISLKNSRDGELILSMIKSGKIPAAVTVESPNIQRAREYALSVAAAIMCEGEEKPCEECKNCRKIKSGHPDVIIVNPVKNLKTGTIAVEEIRKVITDAYVKPNEGDRKVYIFHGELHEISQNAMLKVFEEPPQGVTFIIPCVSESSLLTTILSRATRLVFKGESGGGISESALEISRDMFLKLSMDDVAGFAVAASKLKGNRIIWKECLINLKYLIQQTAVAKITRKTDDELVLNAAKRMSNKSLFSAENVLEELIRRTETNPNEGLFITALCMRMFNNKE